VVRLRVGWVGGWLLAAGVVFVGVLAAAPAVLRAVNVSWPAWLVALVGAVATALGAVVKPAVDACVGAWARRPVRRVEQAQRREELIQEATGGGGFPRIRDLDESDRAWLGIHPAIPLPDGVGTDLSVELPTYVPRDVDARLRTWLTARQRRGGFALVVGQAASGKSRCLYEAVRAVVPDWWLFRPSNGAQVNELVAAGADLSRTVVWLNDLHNVLGGGGLTAATVRRLLANRDRPVIFVGTLWPETFDRYMRPVRKSSDGLMLPEGGDDARDVLSMVDLRIDLPSVFTSQEQERARELAEHDPRLAEATRLDDPRIAETLAAAPELIARWCNPSDPFGAAVITAAVVARRCGHSEPIPVKVVKPLAEHELSADQRATAPRDWFEHAVAWACQPVRGQAAPLVPQASSVGVVDGYRVSDVLVQHASSCADAPAHAVSAEEWNLVIQQASPDVRVSIGFAARHEQRLDIAEQAFRKGADSGDTESMRWLGYLLRERGATEEAEEWFRKGAEAGNSAAMADLGYLLLLGKRGELDEAEEWFRKGAEADDSLAMIGLGQLLYERGELDEAEAWYRKVADAAESAAMALLHERGELDEAEKWWRKAAEAGDTRAMRELGRLLRHRGRPEEAEVWTRRAAATKK